MPKIMTEAQFISGVHRIEEKTKNFSAYVILKDNDMQGKVWVQSGGPNDRSGTPLIRIYLWDWTPEEKPVTQGLSSRSFDADVTEMLSGLTFGNAPFYDHSERRGNWQDQLRARGFKVFQVV